LAGRLRVSQRRNTLRRQEGPVRHEASHSQPHRRQPAATTAAWPAAVRQAAAAASGGSERRALGFPVVPLV
jgi:3-oxoacyl-ACP reductase-like protein